MICYFNEKLANESNDVYENESENDREWKWKWEEGWKDLNWTIERVNKKERGE